MIFRIYKPIFKKRVIKEMSLGMAQNIVSDYLRISSAESLDDCADDFSEIIQYIIQYTLDKNDHKYFIDKLIKKLEKIR